MGDLEGHLPGGEHRHVENGCICEQAPVVSPWASPGHSAEEFRRRAGLSSRDLKSSTPVSCQPLHALSSGGEAGQQRRSHDGDSDSVVAVFKILIFRNYVLKMSTAVPSGPKK